MSKIKLELFDLELLNQLTYSTEPSLRVAYSASHQYPCIGHFVLYAYFVQIIDDNNDDVNDEIVKKTVKCFPTKLSVRYVELVAVSIICFDFNRKLTTHSCTVAIRVFRKIIWLLLLKVHTAQRKYCNGINDKHTFLHTRKLEDIHSVSIKCHTFNCLKPRCSSADYIFLVLKY